MQTQDPYFIYIFIFLIASLVLMLVGLLFVYLRTVTKFAEFRREEAKRLEEPEILIKEAQVKAQKMLQEAQAILVQSQQKGGKTIASADEFLKSHWQDMNNNLATAHKAYMDKYGQTLNSLQQETINLLQSVPKDVSIAFAGEIQKVKMALVEKMDEAQKDARSLVVEAYKKAEAEVSEYKKARLTQVEESIVYILENIARRVLVKEISHDEHEKLVMKALEEAKNQGVFITESNAVRKTNKISDF